MARPGSASRRSSCCHVSPLDADLDQLDAGSRQDRFWNGSRIPSDELREAHMRQKRELTIFVHGRLRSQLARHGESPAVLAEVETILDLGVLTIGFACRFATYKRAGLLFTDMDRLARLLWHADRPVQVIFAGKAHPADRPGQRVIQEIFQHLRSPKLRGRVFILEDYDVRVARFLVQGVDTRPQQPASAAGSLRDVGDEGSAERRPEHQRPRRLVGRGLRGRQRLGHRGT